MEGNVILNQTADGGDISVIRGDFEADGGLATMAYLAMFGGNEDDAGGDDKSLMWWGNFGEDDQSKYYRSETQHLLRSLPLSSSNLRRIEDAAKRDLGVMLTTGIASSVEVTVDIIALNTIRIAGAINAEGVNEAFNFIENWDAEK